MSSWMIDGTELPVPRSVRCVSERGGTARRTASGRLISDLTAVKRRWEIEWLGMKAEDVPDGVTSEATTAVIDGESVTVLMRRRSVERNADGTIRVETELDEV